MPDFNAALPPVSVTNPKGNANAAFPAHLYKSAPNEDNGGLVVAWHGKTPIYNDVITVADAEAKADALKQGYSETPVVKAKK